MKTTLEQPSTLAKLLQPHSLEKFLSENWVKQGIVIPGDRPDKFRSFFSWQQLNELLNFHQLDLRFVLHNKVLPPCDPKDWVKRCREGASLVVSQAQDQVKSLADLSWAIQQELGHQTVQANIYCSWPDRQGFNNHFDSHEVFVLQIDGQKEWFVFEDTVKYPCRDETSESYMPPTGDPYIHSVLNPGDLLYIPRGHWHYAIAREQPALHVTIGIYCFTGRDALAWLFKKLQTTLQNEEALRHNLPFMPYGQSQNMEAHVRQIFDSLSTVLEREKELLVREYALSQLMTTTHAPEISLPGQVGFNILEQGLNTALRQPRFQTVNLKPLDDKTYVLVTPQKTIKFKDLAPKVVETLVKKIFSQEVFTIRDVARWLPDCDLETVILPLLGGLVKEGILVEDTLLSAVPFDRN
ncbi:cupin domain-containing protein [Synechococcus sp. PCC 7336]|uniref:cupin domain-containing protein n=1 Tax=Synechococcus sp. PCC 7336 TaxID=195250 RepID=UPI000346259E|nr:cupin domain-containing protein [Synechococcus sp. PCC 7336]